MFKCLKEEIYIWIERISTDENKRADALSRFEHKYPLKVPQKNIPQNIKFKNPLNPIQIINKITKNFI